MHPQWHALAMTILVPACLVSKTSQGQPMPTFTNGGNLNPFVSLNIQLCTFRIMQDLMMGRDLNQFKVRKRFPSSAYNGINVRNSFTEGTDGSHPRCCHQHRQGGSSNCFFPFPAIEQLDPPNYLSMTILPEGKVETCCILTPFLEYCQGLQSPESLWILF